MPCNVQVDFGVQNDILGLGADVRREVGDFLLRLQDDPLPAGRIELSPKSPGAFYLMLSCGCWISWEILGDPLRLMVKGMTEGITVRILGVTVARLP